jgi:HK97 family phage major capsid protein
MIEEKSLGIEKDIHQELLKNVHKEDRGKIRGLLVPHDIFLGNNRNFVQERATYAVGANNTGGFTVQTDVLADNFVEALRPVSMSLQLGAQVLGGLVGNAQIPTQADTSDTFWLSEGQALTQSESTFGALSMSPKTFGILSKYSRLMLLQSTPQIESIIRRDFAAGMSVGLDAAVLAGTGTNNQPTGILNQANAQVYTVAGANGNALTYNDLVEMEYLAGRANALSQNLAWVGNSAIRKALRKTPKQANGVEGNFLWTELSEEMGKTYDTSIFGKVLGYMFGTTENIPSNYTKGSSSTLNGLIFGNMSNVLIGQWGTLEILSNPYGADDFSRGATTVRALQSVDIAIRNPESFVVCKQFT